jgi:hypothetical protein
MSRLIPQLGHVGDAADLRPLATQKPTLPKDFWQLRQGTSNKFQKAAITTAPSRTAKTNLSTKIRGADVPIKPATISPAIVAMTVRFA